MPLSLFAVVISRPWAAEAGDVVLSSSQALHVVTFYCCLLPAVVLDEQEEKRAELAAYKV